MRLRVQLFVLFIMAICQAKAQSVGIGTTTPNASAVLDVSGNRGLLLPRMTATERNAIVAPVRGLLVFSTTDNAFYCFDGAWRRLALPEVEPRNTILGRSAGLANLTGQANVFIGTEAGLFSEGSYNIFMGDRTGISNMTGNWNLMVGTNAGIHNTNGSGNCFVGSEAGYSNFSGSNLTLIGNAADVGVSPLVNAGAIGYRARVSQSNSFVIGGLGADAVRVGIGTDVPVLTLHVNGTVGGVGPFINLSDSRVKKNILPVTNSLAGILKLQPVSYDWNKEAYPQFKFDDKRQLGFLAQELEKIFPEAVTLGTDGFYTISYSTLIPVVVQGMKEQQQQIDELKDMVKMLVKEMEGLKKQK